MQQQLHSHTFDNQLTLLGHTMPWLRSAAFSLSTPSGCIHDPGDLPGLANFSCEMMQRGCGDRTSRQFVESLERLGVDRSASVSTAHTSFGGAMPADGLFDALKIYSDLLRRPLLPEDQVEEGRMVCFQELRAVEDDLAQTLMMELRRRVYPEPWGRAPYGTDESLQAIGIEDIRRFHQEAFLPKDTIVSVAGLFDWEKLKDHVQSILADWRSRPTEIPTGALPELGVRHIPHESQQTHLAIACPSVPYADENYFLARAAIAVLGSGMSARLFSEVREKRGLCYTVYATLHTLREKARLLCYCGTTSERAQESLDLILAELKRLAEGVTSEELDRVKVRLKSTLVMQQESSGTRSSAMAGDWYHLGRLRSVDELSKLVDALSVDRVNAYLADNPPQPMAIVTLGQKPLETPDEILPSSA